MSTIGTKNQGQRRLRRKGTRLLSTPVCDPGDGQRRAAALFQASARFDSGALLRTKDLIYADCIESRAGTGNFSVSSVLEMLFCESFWSLEGEIRPCHASTGFVPVGHTSTTRHWTIIINACTMQVSDRQFVSFRLCLYHSRCRYCNGAAGSDLARLSRATSTC